MSRLISVILYVGAFLLVAQGLVMMFYGGALLAEGVALPASLLRLIILQGGVLVLIAIPISRAAKAFGIWHETPADARWRVNNLPLHHWIRWWVWRPRRIIS